MEITNNTIPRSVETTGQPHFLFLQSFEKKLAVTLTTQREANSKQQPAITGKVKTKFARKTTIIKLIANNSTIPQIVVILFRVIKNSLPFLIAKNLPYYYSIFSSNSQFIVLVLRLFLYAYNKNDRKENINEWNYWYCKLGRRHL